MKDSLSVCVDAASRVSIVAVDCTSAAAEAARGHLCGPVAAAILGEALACAAAAGAESALEGEAVSLRLDCEGPAGGFLAEALYGGTLRGYTKKKILDDFDGAPSAPPRALFGASAQAAILRSVPGRLLSSGTAEVEIPAKGSAAAAALAALYGKSLQRRIAAEAFSFAGDDGAPLTARAVLAECPPDGDEAVFAGCVSAFGSGAVLKALKTGAGLRTILSRAGLARAEVRETRPLSFACRCSAERAAAAAAALPPEERAADGTVDVYCHFCGKTWTVRAAAAAGAPGDGKEKR